jgi:small-conductance mechanosensitive channel
MLNDITQLTFFQNRIVDYLIFLITITAGILAIKILKASVLKAIKRWSERTSTTIDDFLLHGLEKTLLPILYYGVFYLSIRSLTLHPVIRKSFDVIGVAIITVFGIRFFLSAIEFIFRNYWIKGDEELKEKSFKGILPAIKVVVWGLGIMFLLDNLGFKISTVIAGLGIGGIAIAMASQAILGDLFSYFTILFDRPFKVGDFIIVDNYSGTIEHIGIKTTRIRSLSGEQMIFSNTDLTSSRLRNYKRMDKRRVVFKLGVIYQTEISILKEIPGIIEKIITDIDGATFDRSHFVAFGDFSLDFESVY